MLVDQPLGEATDDRFDTCTVANTVPGTPELREIDFQGGARERHGREDPVVGRTLGNPGTQIAQDTTVGIIVAGALPLSVARYASTNDGSACSMAGTKWKNVLLRVFGAHSTVTWRG